MTCKGRLARMTQASIPDLRAFLGHLQRDGDVAVVEAPVDPHLEVAELLGLEPPTM